MCEVYRVGRVQISTRDKPGDKKKKTWNLPENDPGRAISAELTGRDWQTDLLS